MIQMGPRGVGFYVFFAGTRNSPAGRSNRPLSSAKEIEKEAARIGFPVMMKAAAGGGGKGMRVVREPSELAAAAKAARSESKSAFAGTSIPEVLPSKL